MFYYLLILGYEFSFCFANCKSTVSLMIIFSLMHLVIHFFKSAHVCICVLTCLVMSVSLQPHGLYPARLLCSWGCSRQEYWSGLPCLPPGDLPNPGIEPSFSTLQAILYSLSHHGSPRILEWLAYPFSRGTSLPRNWTGVSCIVGRFFTSWATREALNQLMLNCNSRFFFKF